MHGGEEGGQPASPRQLGGWPGLGDSIGNQGESEGGGRGLGAGAGAGAGFLGRSWGTPGNYHCRFPVAPGAPVCVKFPGVSVSARVWVCACV